MEKEKKRQRWMIGHTERKRPVVSQKVSGRNHREKASYGTRSSEPCRF